MARTVVSATNIEQTLRAVLHADPVEVFDESAQHAGHAQAADAGGGTHFRLRLGSPLFREGGKRLSRIGEHRLVLEALKPYFDAGMHAVEIETF